MKIYDSVGNEIKEGDIVRMYHFTNRYKRRREYMYKKVGKFNEKRNRFTMHHLDKPIDEIKDDCFTCNEDGFKSCVVVQRANFSTDNLKRSKELRD